MPTCCSLAYFGSLSAVCMAAIQAFWLAASGEAERMANLPPSGPMMLSAMSAMTLPVSLKSTWATKTSSPSAEGIGESQVTTVMPLACAAVLRRRPEELQLGRVLELRRRLLGAAMRQVERHDAEEFRQQDHVQRL